MSHPSAGIVVPARNEADYLEATLSSIDARRGDVDGFPDVPNEDTVFSRRLGRDAPTAYCPAGLVGSSGRRSRPWG